MAHTEVAVKKKTGFLVSFCVFFLKKTEKNARGTLGEKNFSPFFRDFFPCPFFLLANILDPRFAGKRLSPTQISLARQFTEEMSADVALGLNLYLAHSPPFRESMFHERAEPISWWQAGKLSEWSSALFVVWPPWHIWKCKERFTARLCLLVLDSFQCKVKGSDMETVAPSDICVFKKNHFFAFLSPKKTFFLFSFLKKNKTRFFWEAPALYCLMFGLWCLLIGNSKKCCYMT